MPGRGRPPLGRGVLSIEDPDIPVPSEALLDTSFVAQALITSQPLHGPCRAFLVRLVEAGTRIVFSSLVDLELAETGYVLALKEQYGSSRWRRARYDGRARRRAAHKVAQVQAAWDELLGTLRWARVVVGGPVDPPPGRA